MQKKGNHHYEELFHTPLSASVIVGKEIVHKGSYQFCHIISQIQNVLQITYTIHESLVVTYGGNGNTNGKPVFKVLFL